MKSLILVAFLLSGPALAGDVVGNGGDGVLRNGQLYLLDLVEIGRYTNPVVSALMPDADSVSRIKSATDVGDSEALILATKLKEIEAYNYSLSRALLVAMEMHQWIFTEEDLANVGDEKSPIAGPFEQIAVRQTPQIYVNNTKYNSLNDVNKAALLLHEMVYSVIQPECDPGCAQASWLVRQTVGQFFAKDFSISGAKLKGDLPNYLPPRSFWYKQNYHRSTSSSEFFARVVYTPYSDALYGGQNTYKGLYRHF